MGLWDVQRVHSLNPCNRICSHPRVRVRIYTFMSLLYSDVHVSHPEGSEIQNRIGCDCSKSESSPRPKHAKTDRCHAKGLTQRSRRFRDESVFPPRGNSSSFYSTKRVRRWISPYPLSLSGSTVLIKFHIPVAHQKIRYIKIHQSPFCVLQEHTHSASRPLVFFAELISLAAWTVCNPSRHAFLLLQSSSLPALTRHAPPTGPPLVSTLQKSPQFFLHANTAPWRRDTQRHDSGSKRLSGAQKWTETRKNGWL